MIDYLDKKPIEAVLTKNKIWYTELKNQNGIAIEAGDGCVVDIYQDFDSFDPADPAWAIKIGFVNETSHDVVDPADFDTQEDFMFFIKLLTLLKSFLNKE